MVPKGCVKKICDELKISPSFTNNRLIFWNSRVAQGPFHCLLPDKHSLCFTGYVLAPATSFLPAKPGEVLTSMFCIPVNMHTLHTYRKKVAHQ